MNITKLIFSIFLLSSPVMAQTISPDLAEILNIPGLGIPKKQNNSSVKNSRSMQSMQSIMQTPTLTEAQKITMREKQSTCFLPGRKDKEWEPRVSAAVVQVLFRDNLGNKIGTGTVVRNSSSLPGGSNAIVTSMHVVEGSPSDTKDSGVLIGIVSSNGDPIGWAEVIARGKKDKNLDKKFVDSFDRGDIAVLRIRGFVKDGEAIFKAIEGVDIRPTLNTQILKGEISDPSGTNPGLSGAGAIDELGRLFGVLVRRSEINNNDGEWKVKGVKLSRPDPMTRPFSNGKRVNKEGIMPQSSISYIEPLLYTDILTALGESATNITIQTKSQEDLESINATIMGFPQGICVTYRGKIVVK